MPRVRHSGFRPLRTPRGPSWNPTAGVSSRARRSGEASAAATWYGMAVTYGQSWLNRLLPSSRVKLITLGSQTFGRLFLLPLQFRLAGLLFLLALEFRLARRLPLRQDLFCRAPLLLLLERG